MYLRDRTIGFCCNCRACMQSPGTAPGPCVQHDGMQELVQAMEHSDGFVLAAPTNMGSATALFKRFMERLAVYGYWPWEAHAPHARKSGLPRKKALLVSSCAAPGFAGRWLYATRGQLAQTARLLGAQAVGTLFAGPLAPAVPFTLPERLQAHAQRLALRLL